MKRQRHERRRGAQPRNRRLRLASLLGTGLAAWSPPGAALGQTPPTTLPAVEVVGPTPLLGSGVDRNKVPGQTQVFSGQEATRQGPPNALGALQNEAQGVHLDNSSGNPFQPDLSYHGFIASPLQGTPAGIAVYVNGARFNNPFGDTVNWDLIPELAIDRIELAGANPVFGLNALGGALSVQLKTGFSTRGGELDIFGGSFGQVAGEFQYGRQSGNTAVYGAGAAIHQDGWRDQQSSDLKQFYGDIGWRGDRSEFHLDLTAAQTELNGPGTAPVQLLQADPAAQYTGPNWIKNDYINLRLSASHDLADTTSVQALAYYENFRQRVGNGNGSPLTVCGDGSGDLCAAPGVVATGRDGIPIPAFLGADGLYGSYATQTTATNGYGASLQATTSDELFGHANQLVAGFSYDGAITLFNAGTAVGGLDPASRTFLGPGTAIALADGSIAPVRASITDAYDGVFLTDTFNLTPALAVTISGRFNAAQIDIKDLIATSLTGTHVYNRFNPAFGATYRFSSGLNLYAGYAESNRAPTPAELTCADPAAPCSLANFFAGDPDLKQVVARSWEAGLRGLIALPDNARLAWNLGAFRTDLADDIIFTQSVVLGTGYFQNVGATRRQGLDAGLRFTSERWLGWLSFSYTDATFQSRFTESSPNNPAADANGNISVVPGNRLPGIPAQLLKLGAQYKLTNAWTVGAVGVAAGGQYLFGDEANLTAKLPGYFRLDLNTSYQITDNIQVFALVQNALDAKYDTYGTFSPLGAVPLEQVPNPTNPRSYNPAAPIGGFGGVRMTF